jgi:uncharacterized protein DUF6881
MKAPGDRAIPPSDIYSEVDSSGYETRKVEKYRDGHIDWADEHSSTGKTGLGEVPIGAIEDIAAQDDFIPTIIDADEFETLWRRATG